MTRKDLVLPVLLVSAVLLVISIFLANPPKPKPQIAPASDEIMRRDVSTCDAVRQEIEDMGQTTAELRKVLRDVARLTCK